MVAFFSRFVAADRDCVALQGRTMQKKWSLSYVVQHCALELLCFRMGSTIFFGTGKLKKVLHNENDSNVNAAV